jgi:hypothetical protein
MLNHNLQNRKALVQQVIGFDHVAILPFLPYDLADFTVNQLGFSPLLSLTDQSQPGAAAIADLGQDRVEVVERLVFFRLRGPPKCPGAGLAQIAFLKTVTSGATMPRKSRSQHSETRND